MSNVMQESQACWRDGPAILRLDRREIHVWRASLDIGEEQLNTFSEFLSDEERQRAQRFHFPKDRGHFIASHGILRNLLALYQGWPPESFEFSHGPHGKPFLAGPTVDLQFNMAHSHDLALYAFARDREVGVDVEYLKPGVAEDKVPERFFSPQEVAKLRTLPTSEQQEAFFCCWTRKEAYLKANGEGLAFGLNQFTVSLAPGEPATLLATPLNPSEAGRWSIRHLVPGAGYAGALAVRGPTDRLSCWQWLP